MPYIFFLVLLLSSIKLYSVPRESELRSLNKPHNAGVITLTQAIHICSGITIVKYQVVLCT